MKKIVGLCTGIFAATFFSAAAANANITGDVNDYLFKRTAAKVVESYTDNTVVKTIDLLREQIEKLDSAVQKFKESKSEKHLAAVAKAMKGSFEQFNSARIFRYGPSAHYDFDKQLATWPFDKVMVDYNISEIEGGRMKMNTAILRAKNSSNRGLHTVKYLIYETTGNLRDLTDISESDLTYLTAVTGVMLEDAIDYQASWLGTKNMTQADQTILHSAGKRIRTSYAKEFKNPGEVYSRYFSVSIALQELIGEATVVLEDMVPLIEELPKYGNTQEIKYWDSVTPFKDIISQLKGVQNSYMGGVDGARGAAYADLTDKRDKQLNERIIISLAHAIKRAEIASTMNDKPLEKREQAAKLLLSEVEKLTTMFMAATALVAADAATNPFAAYGSDLN
jgi:putative iron-regulated protein